MNQHSLRFALPALVLSIASLCLAQPQEVVYDGLTNTQTRGSSLARQTGASVTLAGTARAITRVDILTTSTISPELYRVHLRGIDSNGFPSTIFWISDPQISIGAGAQTLSVNVPLISVSDSFAWVLERLNPPGGSQLSTRFTTPPTIGSSITGFYFEFDVWKQAGNNSQGSFGARIYAIVPEPTTTSLCLAASACLFCRQFVRNSRRVGRPSR